MCGYLVDRCYDFVQGDIFEGLDIKTNKDLESQKAEAFGGIEIKDTDDYYEDIKAVFPENGNQVTARVKMIGEFYSNKHVQNQGKSVAYVVTSHREVMASLPEKFSDEMYPKAFDYCGLFEIVIKGNDAPHLTKVSYSTRTYN